MAELGLTITSDGEPAATVDRITGQLLREMSALGVGVRRPNVPAPAGAKSAVGSSIGQLVITGMLSTGTIAGIANIVSAYLKRHNGRTVTVKKGDLEVTLIAQPPKVQLELLRTLMAEEEDAEPRG
jgi:hypothetical protein